MDFNVLLKFENNNIVIDLYYSDDIINENDIDNLFEGENLTYEFKKENFNLNFIKKQVIEKLKLLTKNKIDNNINIQFIIEEKAIEDKNNMITFIRENKDLPLTIFIDDYKLLIDNLKQEDFPNLIINFKNSYDNITYKEFYNMYSKLNEIVRFVKHYNLSQLEIVMLVYDIVKANEYKIENENENHSVSRSLNRIINSDKIVCVGYTNLMDFLLKNLGINSNIIDIDYLNKDTGHVRNLIHLKDDKYNIDGMFFLDATWDSKRDNKYINNYYYFLKSLRFFKLRNENETFQVQKVYNILQKTKKEIIQELENNDNFITPKISLSLKYLKSKYSKINMVPISSKEKTLELLDEVFDKYNKKIPQEAFKNALYKVRKVEYINGIIDFLPTEEYMNSICDKYYKKSAEQNLFDFIFGIEDPTVDIDLNDAKATSIDEDLLRIRLLKALKEKIGDMPTNDYIKKM